MILPYNYINSTPTDDTYSFDLEQVFSMFNQLQELDDVECLFSFIAKEEELSDFPEDLPEMNTTGSGCAVFDIKKMRKEAELVPPTHEFALDSINVRWFFEQANRIDTCEINSALQSERRKNQLIELLAPGKIPLISILFTNIDHAESTYITNFQPSTWHKVWIGKRNNYNDIQGLPSIRAEDDQIEEGVQCYLLYACPVTNAENDLLKEIISLNHILDAGV